MKMTKVSSLRTSSRCHYWLMTISIEKGRKKEENKEKKKRKLGKK